MIRTTMLIRAALLLGLVGGVASTAEPAAAQVTCPAGYVYTSLQGCVPAGDSSSLREPLLRRHFGDSVPASSPHHVDGSSGRSTVSGMSGGSHVSHMGGGFRGGSFFGGSFGHGIR